MMSAYVAVGIGAVFGANARYWVSTLIANRYGARFPYATLAINITGSFLLGLAYSALAPEIGLTGSRQLLLATGFLGAYTTFSTFTYETLALLRQGSPRLAVLNVAGSATLGLAAAGGGLLVGRLLAGLGS
jgi:CrcB protein